MKFKFSKISHYPILIKFLTKSDDRLVDFKAEEGEITVRYENDNTIIYCGIGESSSLTASILRTSSAKAIQKASELNKDKLSIILPDKIDMILNGSQAIVEGIILGSYKFSKYKSEKPFQVENIEIVGPISTSDLHRASIISESVNYARDLVNENASIITPERLAKEALALGKSNNCKVTVLKEKELSGLGLNLIGAVGQGSPTPPRLIIVEYSGSSSKVKTAIVGKGITFDSGGQNLKPTGSIETMREDMAGAAAVLGVLKALITLKAAVNVIGVIPAAHNAIGENSFFPGDIYKSYNGKTVEIHSTDAEGRLILADAVSYCQDCFKPTEMIDLATLTGGVLSALGDLVAGLFSNDDALAERLFKSGEKTNERLWRLPLYKEYSDSLKGDLGDLRNLSKFKKGYASSIVGAAFIQEFIKDIPWAHIDIAGTSFNDGSVKGEIPQFGTGFGVRLLIDFLLNN